MATSSQPHDKYVLMISGGLDSAVGDATTEDRDIVDSVKDVKEEKPHS